VGPNRAGVFPPSTRRRRQIQPPKRRALLYLQFRTVDTVQTPRNSEDYITSPLPYTSLFLLAPSPLEPSSSVPTLFCSPSLSSVMGAIFDTYLSLRGNPPPPAVLLVMTNASHFSVTFLFSPSAWPQNIPEATLHLVEATLQKKSSC
jgi:hypothetical protein